jgi:hypothetical protein
VPLIVLQQPDSVMGQVLCDAGRSAFRRCRKHISSKQVLMAQKYLLKQASGR